MTTAHRKLAQSGAAAYLSMRAAIQSSTRAGRRDRGDVPGWVLITVMTAGLVAALWVVAGPKLTEMLTTALTSVTGKG